MTAAELLRAQLEEHNIEEDEPILQDDDNNDEYDDEDEDEKDDDDVEGGDASARSRSEKKCRKAMERLGMKAITGVSRVTIKQSKTATFVLLKPDVFKSSQSETYVMLGVVKMEDMDAQLLTEAAEQSKASVPSSIISKGEQTVEEAQDDEVVDETGIDKKDVELVMAEAPVSRSRAVKALKAADGDIVSAIMELTN
ncbi:nascent polypeptide-associated complex subunit alpha-like protein 1 [Triticum urartu]|uniref:nascent polypeptide-associated complex subunit alpha-like protein 1 n=1 Tax=Triticum urartu TaxID=4572 RepID=UPI0020437519|nr:nascent polypeptide-associated complex subunit alpha-like protein 1 [Triticum urartu]